MQSKEVSLCRDTYCQKTVKIYLDKILIRQKVLYICPVIQLHTNYL